MKVRLLSLAAMLGALGSAIVVAGLLAYSMRVEGLPGLP